MLLDAYNEERRRQLRRALIERLIVAKFALKPGGWVRRGEVQRAAAELLECKMNRILLAEVNSAAIAAGYRLGKTKGVRVFRRPRRV